MAVPPIFTEVEFKQFDSLTRKTGSPDQLIRIAARIDLRHFVQMHGKPKCDAMDAILLAQEAAR